MRNSAWRHCRAREVSMWLRTEEGMSHHCWGSQGRSSSCCSDGLRLPSQHASQLHARLGPCTKRANNHWFPLKYAQRQSCWSHLCYPEVGDLTKGVGEAKVQFPLLCLEGSNTVFLCCLSHQSAARLGT